MENCFVTRLLRKFGNRAFALAEVTE